MTTTSDARKRLAERAALNNFDRAIEARDELVAARAALAERDAEVGLLREEVERFRPLWASPLASPSRWVSEPIPYPRPYVSTFDVLKTYDESIRCSSNWPAESRHASMDKALRSVPGLAYEIDFLRQDLDEARAEVERLREQVEQLRCELETEAEHMERHHATDTPDGV